NLCERPASRGATHYREAVPLTSRRRTLRRVGMAKPAFLLRKENRKGDLKKSFLLWGTGGSNPCCSPVSRLSNRDARPVGCLKNRTDLLGNRRFESISLQRRVRSELL